MKRILISSVLLCTPFTLLAQGWYWQNPLPQGNTLQSVHVFNQDTLVAVGEAGTILKTTDGGATWISQASGTTNSLHSVFFTDPNAGWAVGDTGTILHTTNGGTDWTSETSGTTNNLQSVSFTDPNSGWAVGDSGTVLHTSNGGTDWTSQTSGTTNSLHSVSFTDPNTGWAVGDSGTILHTINGGTNWSPQTSGTTDQLSSIFFTDSTTGWAVGDSGTILHTIDGGTSWTLQTSGTTSYLYSVFSVNANIVWAVGDSATILRTTDGGTSWTAQTFGVEIRLSSVFFADSSTGWAVGQSGVILQTTDGGVDWVLQAVGKRRWLASVFFADSSRGWTAGEDGTILHTTDGGTSWPAQTSGTNDDLFTVFFTNPTTGWAVGLDGTIVHTTDGGTNWLLQASGTPDDLYAIFFTDPSRGWVVGEGGTILHTINGGTSWAGQSSGTTEDLYPVFFTDSTTGWAAGESGTIVHTTDGGTNWTSQTSGTNDDLYSIIFPDPSTGWAVGQRGAIFHTTDGGINWTPQTSRTTRRLEAVFFTGPSRGWTVGERGTILHTTNGGTDWIPQISGTTNDLFSVFFIDPSKGWTAGELGTILHTTTGGAGTEPPMFAPVLLSPPDSAIGVLPGLTLTWYPSPDAEYYALQVSETIDFSSPVVEEDNLVATSLDVTGLSTGTTHYWRVAGLNAGGTSPWSEVWNFTTLALPAQVAVLSPPDGDVILSDSVTFLWLESSPVVDRYWFEYGTDSSFSVSTIDSLVTDTVATARNLAHHGTYYWRVRAHNEAGWGPFSEVRDFLVLTREPLAPLQVSPLDSAADQPLTMNFVWGTTSSALLGQMMTGETVITKRRNALLIESPLATDTVWYHLQLATDAGFTDLLVNDSTIVDTTDMVSTLSIDHTYYWRVRARNLFGASPWSEVWNFTTLALPAQIVVLSPSDGDVILSDSVTHLWRESSPVVDRYWFEYGTDSIFSVSTIDSLVTDTVTTARNLAHHETYYWRVRAHNEAGWGPFSEVRDFLVLTREPLAPLQVSPPDSATDQSLAMNFVWRTVSSALLRQMTGEETLITRRRVALSIDSPSLTDTVWYHLQLATFPGFADLLVNDSTLVDTTDVVSSLSVDVTYYWRVRARNLFGASPWSEVWSFTTLALPGQIAALSPSDGDVILSDSVTCLWREGSPVVDRYWFEYGTDSSFSVSAIDSMVTDTVTTARSLAHHETYYWRVRAHNEAGWGPFSEVRDFLALTREPLAPLQISPSDSATDQPLTMTFVWHTVSSALLNQMMKEEKVLAHRRNDRESLLLIEGPSLTDTVWYHLQLATDAGFTGLLVNDSTLVDTTDGVSSLSIDQTYYWRVRARNLFGASPWSEVWNFTTLPVPVQVALLSPSDEAVVLSDSVACLWREGSPVVDRYWFEYGTDSSFSVSAIDSMVTDTVATARSLTHHETYYWRVRAHNEAGWGPFSEVRDFLVLTREPLAPLQVSPSDSATDQPLTMTFVWRGVSSAMLSQLVKEEKGINRRRNDRQTSLLIEGPSLTDTVWYHLQLATDAEFTELLLSDSTLVDTTDMVSSLSMDVTYYWRVRARNLFGASPWSEVWSFTTLALPGQIAVLSPSDGDVILGDSVTCLWREGSPVVDRYWFEYGTDSSFSVSTIDSLVTDTVTTARNLAHHETYFWRVRAHNEAGWGPFSEVRDFLVLTREPLAPLQVSPSDSAADQPLTATFVWRTVSSALLGQMMKEETVIAKRRTALLIDGPSLATDTVWYHLQLATDAEFIDLLVNDSTRVDTTDVVSSLSIDQTYYWRVRARNLFGASPWSEVWSFTTLAIPAQVALLSPSDEAVVLSDSVACLWREGSPVVDRYWFEYGTDSSFTVSTIDLVTDTVATARNLAHHETYYWRVRAHNEAGWGPFSDVRDFLVLTREPLAPLQVSPSDSAANQPLTMTFVWRTVSSALLGQMVKEGKAITQRRNDPEASLLIDPLATDTVWYHLQLATDIGFTDLLVSDSTLVDTTDEVNSLSMDVTYYWRVRARNLFGAGPWSEVWSFTTIALPAQVVLAGPENGAVLGQLFAICRWYAGMPVIDRYWFEWAADSLFTNSVIDSTVTDTISIASPLQDNQTYYWKVRAHNAIGWGEFSEVWSFSVLLTGIEDEEEVPVVYSLHQNYPNPFNPSTTIRYGLPERSHVSLEVYNMVGQRVATLIDGEQQAGWHEVVFEDNTLASGLYIYRLTAGEFVDTRKLVLLK